MPSNAPVFMMEVISAKLLSTDKLKGYILAAQEKNKREMKTILDFTTSTWKDERPVMQVDIKFAGGGVIIVGAPADNGSLGTKKWHWLNSGTQIRYATMTKGFKAKTKPGMIHAVTGNGKKAFVNKKVPRPGIAARHWNISIPRLMRPRFTKSIQDAVRKGLQP